MFDDSHGNLVTGGGGAQYERGNGSDPGPVPVAAIDGLNHFERFLQVHEGQNLFRQLRGGNRAVGRSRHGARSCQGQRVGAAFVAEQVAPAAGAIELAVR